MNANELADKLDEAADDLEAENIFAWEERAGATMLRQQQAEIKALKEFKRQYETLNRNVINDLMLAKSEIETLKRPNNVVGVPQDKLTDMQVTIRQLQAENEALKALLKDESESFDRTASHMAGEYIAYKDLSDQEIMNLFYQTSGQDPIGFAKAILRKASER